MSDRVGRPKTLPDAREDVARARSTVATPQTEARSYRLAFLDTEFLLKDELRPVRLQLELMKPELELQARGIDSTIVIFGSARIESPQVGREAAARAAAAATAAPDDAALARRSRVTARLAELSRYYEEARRFARLAAAVRNECGKPRFTIVTGGGPGIMEAANRGASEAGAPTIGHNIVLPHEQAPNPYVSPELCFQFHYFALRKMHLLTRAKALLAFPGGYGTMDELFETLCLIQTGKARPMPVLLFGADYWRRIVDFEAMLEEGVIDPRDLGLFRTVETAEEAWAAIAQHYGIEPPQGSGTDE
jgi:uncharacterized protein (TIGR00730 family)